MENEIKILLVDDEEDFRKLLAFWLKSRGYCVVTAGNGQEAIQSVKLENPDIIFLDINMPVLDGLDTLKELREFNKDVPVIIISAHVDDDKAKEALKYDISGIFHKENNFDESLSLLEIALKKHKQLKK